MRLMMRWRTIVTFFTVATAIYAIRTKQSNGTFLNVLFQFRVPIVQRLRDRLWNPQVESVLTPSVFGVGWSVNLYEVLRRLGFLSGEADASSNSSPPL